MLKFIHINGDCGIGLLMHWFVKTADLLGFLQTIVSRVYRNGVIKIKRNKNKFCGPMRSEVSGLYSTCMFLQN